MLKVDFKLESDNIWRAYIKIFANHVWDIDIEGWDMLYIKEGYTPKVWVPIAASRRKELCVKFAKDRVNEIPKHFYKTA